MTSEGVDDLTLAMRRVREDAQLSNGRSLMWIDMDPNSTLWVMFHQTDPEVRAKLDELAARCDQLRSMVAHVWTDASGNLHGDTDLW